MAAAVVLMVAVAARAQSSCASGQTCSVTLDGQVYTVVGPCDLSSVSTISGCLVIGVAPALTPPPTSSSCTGDLILCGAPTAIVQDFYQTATQPLEDGAKAAIASLRGIPNDTLNDFWSRGEIRAYMYLRILGMANSTTPLSSQDQAVVNYYTNAVNNERLTIASEAMNLYIQWNNDPCGFQVPVGPDPNSYIESEMGTLLDPGPCALPPNSPACLNGGCIPPPPPASQFTDWATGVVFKNDIDGWGQLLYSESGVTFQPTTNPPQTALQVAQGSADFEYDAAFGGIAEGVEYLTAKHAAIANIPSSTETQAESDFQGAWLDGLHDFAGDQFRDVVKTSLQNVFQAAADSNESTLAQTFGVETPFTQAEEELGLVAEEEAGDLFMESWDTFVGPAIAAGAVIAVSTWQQVNNAQVLTDLQTSLCQASGGQLDQAACSTTSQESLHDYAQDSEGRALILDAFIRSTMPDFSVTRLASSYGSAPAAGPVSSTDPSFLEGNATTPRGTFSSQDWNGTPDTTSVANGWFVQSAETSSGPSQLTYVPSVAYLTPNSTCTTTPTGTECKAANPELWRAWLDGDQFLAQREAVEAGIGTVENLSVCVGTSCISNGAIKVSAAAGTFTFPIQQGDDVSIEGQVRQVQAVTTDSSGNVTSFLTTEPFGDDPSGNLPQAEVQVLAHPDGNCLTSSSLGSRVTGNDCTEGPSISTSRGIVTIAPPATVAFNFSTLSPKTYGDQPFSVAGFVSSNSTGAFSFSAGPDSVGCTVDASGMVTITGAGTCVLDVSQAAAGTYGVSLANVASFKIAPALLSITASSAEMSYGGTVPAITPGYSGFVNGDTPSNLQSLPTCTTTATSTSPVGSYQTSCSSPPVFTGGTCTGDFTTCTSTIDLSPNYTPVYYKGTLTINPAIITVIASSPSMTYGGTVPTITPSYTGFVDSDTSSIITTLPTCSTNATSTSPVGDAYTSTCSGAATTNTNYAIGYQGGFVKIKPAPLQIIANNFTKVYGQTLTLPGTGFTTEGLLNNDTVTAVKLTSAGAAATATVLGEPYPVVPSNPTGSGLTNYSISFTNGKLAVTPAPLTITADSMTKTYGQAITFNGTEFAASPLLNGDKIGGVTLNSSGAAADAPVSGSPYAIVPSDATGGAVSNYRITYTDGELRVKPATPTSVRITNLPAGAIAVGSFTPSVTVTVAYGSDSGATSVALGTSDAGICTISSTGVVTFVGAGTCYLTASVASAANYTASSGQSQGFVILSPQMATGNIINYVNALNTQGLLSSGQDNSLLKELNQAIDMMNKGKINGAIQNLQYFISEVQDLYSSGVLNAAEANTMITAANNVITALGSQ